MTSAGPERLRAIARRVIWWKDPESTLANEPHFLAHAMTWGTWDEMDLVRSVYGDDRLRRVLDDPPPGVFDQRSWNYWHAKFGRTPPRLPVRRL